jgi:hypothetical protein
MKYISITGYNLYITQTAFFCSALYKFPLDRGIGYSDYSRAASLKDFGN